MKQQIIKLHAKRLQEIDRISGFNLLATPEYASNTIVVIMSDHGEEFMEHGRFQHLKGLYNELLRFL